MTATVRIGATASEFGAQIGNLPNIDSYNPTFAVVTLDASGNPTAGTPAGWEYSIIINRYRPTTPLPTSSSANLVAGSVPVSLTVTRTNHSPPLSGTFSLLVNNVPLQVGSSSNIPFSVSAWDIKGALNKQYQSREISVDRVMFTQT